MSNLSTGNIKRDDVVYFSVQCKGGKMIFPFTVKQTSLETCVFLHFTTIKYLMASGKSFPEFFRLKHPDHILSWGIAASYDAKHIFMVVYVDGKRGCIANACYLIQLDQPTYLTPSLYVTNKAAYKSFAKLVVKNDVFYQNIQADRFEVDGYYPSTRLEMSVRLSNDNGATWSRFKLSFSIETMTPTLTLIPPDEKP